MPDHATRAAATGVRRAARIGLGAVAAVSLAGCGPDLDTPEGVTRAFVAAMADRRWEDACELLSHDLVHRATDGESRYCALHLERRHPDTSRYETLDVQDGAGPTEDGYRLQVVPEHEPERPEEVTVVEESGRLVLLRYPGRDTAVR